jgi:protein-S-isoprenylcysteine O-methyltransferase Ste14
MLKVLSLIGYVGMTAGVVGLLWTQSLFSSSVLIILLQVAAILLFLWARFTFGWRSYHVAANSTLGGLVTNGPYRYIRHPIYVAFCLFTSAGAAAHWSWRTGMLIAVVFMSALVRIFCEETLVTQLYPEYRQYAAATWRLIPFIF